MTTDHCAIRPDFHPHATQMPRSSTIWPITFVEKRRRRYAGPSSSVLKRRATVFCFRTSMSLRSRKDFRNTERPCVLYRHKPSASSLVL